MMNELGSVKVDKKASQMETLLSRVANIRELVSCQNNRINRIADTLYGETPKTAEDDIGSGDGIIPSINSELDILEGLLSTMRDNVSRLEA